MKFELKGGQDFHWIKTGMRSQEMDRRGGVLLKTSGETKGNPGESGTGSIIYHWEVKIKESRHYIGNNTSKGAAEYISIILGLREMKRTFRCIRNKIIIIHIKSQLVANKYEIYEK